MMGIQQLNFISSWCIYIYIYISFESFRLAFGRLKHLNRNTVDNGMFFFYQIATLFVNKMFISAININQRVE